MPVEVKVGDAENVNKPWALALAVPAIAVLLSCTSTPPTPAVQPEAPPATESGKVAAVTTQQPAKPAHVCVTTESWQRLVADSQPLLPGIDLRLCFLKGYQGIGCGDNREITDALDHGLSNRERAQCDAIMRRYERGQAAEESRKKRLDEAYDKQHGLKPAK